MGDGKIHARRTDAQQRSCRACAAGGTHNTSYYTARKSEHPQDVSAKMSAGCTEIGNEFKMGSEL